MSVCFLIFSGGPIDGPQFGVPPQPWDIPVIRPQDFKTDKKVISVPHTASVKVFLQCYRHRMLCIFLDVLCNI